MDWEGLHSAARHHRPAASVGAAIRSFMTLQFFKHSYKQSPTMVGPEHIARYCVDFSIGNLMEGMVVRQCLPLAVGYF